MCLADVLSELLAEQHAQLLQRLGVLQEAVLTAVNGSRCRGVSSHKLRHFHDIDCKPMPLGSNNGASTSGGMNRYPNQQPVPLKPIQRPSRSSCQGSSQ